MTRVRFTAMTKSEMQMIRDAANFTETQDQIFLSLCKGDVYNYAICQRMCMDPRAFYRHKKIVEEKCERVIRELKIGYLMR